MRRNNFDLLRLFFAFMVIGEHAYLVGLHPINIKISGFVFSGYTALQCFFVISGYLVFQSWENSSTWRSYLSKRVRRVYPAYFTVVLAMAVFGVLMSPLDLISYFTSKEWIRYLIANLAFLNFLQPTLPGVFAHSVEPTVNGPLWTIKIEVMFYLTVPFIALIGRRINLVWVMLALYVGSTIWAMVFGHLHASTGKGAYEILGRQLPGQMAFFVAGGLLYYFYDAFKRYAHLLAALSVIAMIAHILIGLPWLFPAALAIIVIYVAGIFPYLGNIGRFGDFSYGLYIFHYPVLHVVAFSGVAPTPEVGFAVGVLASIVLAFLSWHLIEKPALLRTSHYRAAEAASKRKAATPAVAKVTRNGAASVYSENG